MHGDDRRIIEQLYARFNARDIEGVLEALDADVAWANAMEGGHEHGHQAVRAYWTRQWAIVSPIVTPKAFRQPSPGEIVVEVDQRVFDLEGRPLDGEQAHDLEDKTVEHIFRIKDGKVVRFNVA